MENKIKKNIKDPATRDKSRYRRLKHLNVPKHLHRNSWIIQQAGFVKTGKYLMDLTLKRINEESYENLNVLDVGCGVRFAQTIINRDINIKKYIGIEVNPNLVRFLKRNVETFDERFQFTFWPCYNEKFSPHGLPINELEGIPNDSNSQIDLITGYSLFTHLNPSDSLRLLEMMREISHPKTKLFFSVFVDEESENFEDRMPGKPLSVAYYKKSYFEKLIDDSGWKIIQEWPKEMYIQHSYYCELK